MSIVLLDCPPPKKKHARARARVRAEDILNGNHKQLHGGKGNDAHQQTTNLIYMITRTEIGFTDRPRGIRNPKQLILKIIEHRISDLVLFSVRILGCQHKKTLICDTALSIRVSPRKICIKAAPRLNSMMSKEPKQKTNRHMHSTRDQNTGPFSKRKIKEVFSAIGLNRVVSGPFVQKKAKKRS